MKQKTMLDSGAYSVYRLGIEIDLDEYIEYCATCPQVSYFVNLDVIPGVYGNPASINGTEIERCSQASWNNYRKMIKTLPIEKVIPVFHQGDEVEWLKRYIKFGTPYIGLSPDKNLSIAKRMKWMRGLQGIISDNGKPIVKTHIFGTTFPSFLFAFECYSVDSTLWLRHAAYGKLLVPRSKGGKYDYSLSPFSLAVSKQSPDIKRKGASIDNVRGKERKYFLDYIESLGVPLGESDIVKVKSLDYELKDNEEWLNKKKLQILRKKVLGLTNYYVSRHLANVRYTNALQKNSWVRRIYFAGASSTKEEVLREIKSYFYAFSEYKQKGNGNGSRKKRSSG